MTTTGTWRAWLGDRPTMVVRVGTGVGLVGLIAAAIVVPSNLSAFPIATRVAAVGVGAAIAGSGMGIWERRPGNVIGPLLVGAGLLWILGRMQGAGWAPLALVANLGNSVAQAILLAVLVACPRGACGFTAPSPSEPSRESGRGWPYSHVVSRVAGSARQLQEGAP